MELIEKFNNLNNKVELLELERKKVIQEIENMKSEIKDYLNNEKNSLEDRFILYYSLPYEMLNQYFGLYGKNCPKSFEKVLDKLYRSLGDYIENIGIYFAEWFDFKKKQIDYKNFASELMNGQYKDEEIKQATQDAFNFLIKNMIGSI